MAGVPGTPGLLEQLEHFAALQPDKVLYTYLNDDGKTIASYTYRDLATKSTLLGRHILMKAGDGKLKRGDRILLVFLPSLEFILAFVACLRVGLVPVPVYPPDPRRTKAYITAFAQIAGDCGATVALSHADYLRAIQLSALAENAKKLFTFGLAGRGAGGKTNEWPDLLWLNSTELVSSSASASASALLSDGIGTVNDSQPAFLQYTSGSTADPKGVIITHGSLKHNLATIVSSLEAGTDTVVASWLPQYHDMGLIGSLLGVLYCGGSGYYMSPLSFIKRPVLWIETMSRYKATHVQSPNFGYKLAARKWRESRSHHHGSHAGSEALDLSSVRHMFNAAEPITSDSIVDFLATFAPFGLKPEAMRPGYGLAEHTVYVSDAGTRALRIDKARLEHDEVAVQREVSIFDLDALATLHDEGAHSGSTAASSPADVAVEVPPASSSSVSPSTAASLLPGTVVISCGPVAPFSGTLSPSGVSRNADVLALIVNKDTCIPVGASEARVGEVWLCSPSCAAGYWASATRQDIVAGINAEVFGAQLRPPSPSTVPADASSSSPAAVLDAPALFERYKGMRFLRTGDLGFVHRGELYICGRAKDLIIVRGRNHYPQDVEATVESISLDNSAASVAAPPALLPIRPGASAAFQAAVVSAEEGLVVVAEVRDAAMPQQQLVSLRDAIRTAVAKEHGEGLSALLLLKPHTARKTTSGKIARKWNKKAFLEMHSDPASPWHPNQGNVLLDWRVSEIEAAAAAATMTTEVDGSTRGGNPSTDEAALYQSNAGLASTALDGAAPIAGATSTTGVTAPSAAPPTAGLPFRPANVGVTGAALQEALAGHVARLLRADPSSLRADVALVDTGLDSMAMVQLGPIFRDSYGLYVRDEHLFNTGLTVRWMVDNAEALRRPYSADAPPNADGSLHAEAVAAVPVPPHDQNHQPAAPVGGATGAGQQGANGGAGGSPVATAMTDGPGGVPVAMLPPRRHQPSWFERNFPCCAWCF